MEWTLLETLQSTASDVASLVMAKVPAPPGAWPLRSTYTFSLTVHRPPSGPWDPVPRPPSPLAASSLARPCSPSSSIPSGRVGPRCQASAPTAPLRWFLPRGPRSSSLSCTRRHTPVSLEHSATSGRSHHSLPLPGPPLLGICGPTLSCFISTPIKDGRERSGETHLRKHPSSSCALS